MNSKATWIIYYRTAQGVPWLPCDDARTEAEACHWMVRMLRPGEYRVGPGHTRPAMTEPPEHTVARPKPPRQRRPRKNEVTMAYVHR